MKSIIKRLKELKASLKKFTLSFAALYSHKYNFKKDEYEYYQSYSDEPANNELGGCLIAMFDGKQIHCGVTDRFKGICSGYEFSKEFGLPFYVNYISPFNLTDYFLPNQYDWRVDKSKILYNKNTSVPVFLNDWQSEIVFHKLYLKKVIKNNPGKQIHLYINTPYYIDKYPTDFHFLFKPSQELADAINAQIEKLGNEYVAMAFRFLQLLGDFKEEHSIFKTLSEPDQTRLMEKCEKKVLELREKNKINSKILLTGDSMKFLNYMQERHDFVYVIPGSIEHTDNGTSHSDSGNLKTFLDMCMLSKAKCIYQICTDGMYKNSAFARQAATLGGAKYIKVIF